MTGTCLNCDGPVSDDFVRVFAPDHLSDGTVRFCPHCTAVKDGSRVRQARSRGKPNQTGEVKQKDGGRV